MNLKEKILEEIDDAIVTHEKIKAKYLDKNLEMYIRAGGAIFALQSLRVDLDNLLVRLQTSNQPEVEK